jgi:hypothetical protein
MTMHARILLAAVALAAPFVASHGGGPRGGPIGG